MTTEASNKAYELHLQAIEHLQAGRLDESLECRRQTVELIPDDPIYLLEYADNLARQRRWNEDLHYAELAATYEPSCAEAWGLAGAAAANLGLYEKARRYYERSLKLVPNVPNIELNYALLLLTLREYERGWEVYRWRAMAGSSRRTLKPEWDGSPIPGRTLFVWSEQGVGDTLQFMRFLKLAKERSGAHVVLEAPRDLVTLLKGRTAADEISTHNRGHGIITDNDDFEHVSLMSLPRVFGLVDEADFWDGPYLESGLAFLPGDASALRVGVCWGGNPAHANNHNRIVAFEQFASLLGVDGVNYYSINPSCRFSEQESSHSNCFDIEITDFVATAAIIKSLDLVITTDTAVGHLAGAMGKPVWLLIPFVPDWRWSLERDTTPWYPHTTLYRQSRIGDWTSVLEVVRTRLECDVEARRKGRAAVQAVTVQGASTSFKREYMQPISPEAKQLTPIT